MFSKFIPWKWLVRRLARRHGFFDPFDFIARIRQYSQPSEVQEPIELLRAGAKFHARGLINTKAIQHNLDWVWPYWVHQQFDPKNPSFLPRAFSFSHVNLTHRNWTAVGLPDSDSYSLVDPRGMVTPLLDGWSLDFWIEGKDGKFLIPSQAKTANQTTDTGSGFAVATEVEGPAGRIGSRVEMRVDNGTPTLCVDLKAQGDPGGRLFVTIRPYNPEGIQFIDQIQVQEQEILVFEALTQTIRMADQPDAVFTSNYDQGDVLHQLEEPEGLETSVKCRVGMATAALAYDLDEQGSRSQSLQVPIEPTGRYWQEPKPDTGATQLWQSALAPTAALEIPDAQKQGLYDNAVRTLVLLSASDVVPGPYTYRRFWFRDACLMLNALLGLGLDSTARRQIACFPEWQRADGYFHSQEGEWDSNGQVLWILDRYQQLSGEALPESWRKSLVKGADWILRKRGKGKRLPGTEGLLPAGFSAEHLGPNDYYYWDNFWSLKGLECAIRQGEQWGEESRVKDWKEGLSSYQEAVWNAVAESKSMKRTGAIAAAPGRRMDAGAIGSMVVDYPLQLTDRDDKRVKATLEFLLSECRVAGGFFQDMIHSGINAYLTLDLAQTLLRFGDTRYRDLIQAVADLASPTGNWPEAIHPLTRGGCMGDGQHGWAAAEWVLMMRSLFLREEGDGLVLCSGLDPEWYEPGQTLKFGPTPTPWGRLTVSAHPAIDGLEIEVAGEPRTQPASISVEAPGCEKARLSQIPGSVHIPYKNS